MRAVSDLVAAAGPDRLAGVKVIGVDEHRWAPRRVGAAGFVTLIIDLTPTHDHSGPALGYKTAAAEVIPDAKATMSSRRRHRVRPSWAISSRPAGTPRRMELIRPSPRCGRRRRIPRSAGIVDGCSAAGAFDHHASNGATEAINGRLEALRRNALGFRNLTKYRWRSLCTAAHSTNSSTHSDPKIGW